jgi:GH25 family lysozyme M1 (1,4-beta-N-acetylmuramidase)
MEEQKEKQMNVDVVDTTEGQSEMEQMAEVRTGENKASTMEEDLAPLFENAEAEEFRSHWLEIQSRFVDDPRASVKEADELVANVIKSITRSFADRRISLENQWNSGENNVSTEDMRVAIKRYRSFFNRLLSLES